MDSVSDRVGVVSGWGTDSDPAGFVCCAGAEIVCEIACTSGAVAVAADTAGFRVRTAFLLVAFGRRTAGRRAVLVLARDAVARLVFVRLEVALFPRARRSVGFFPEVRRTVRLGEVLAMFV